MTGAEALDIFSDQANGVGALNIANLTTFDASAATGDITAWFFGRGTGALAATGGSGNDDFVFGTANGGGANFTSADSVNGGGGTNTLSIEVENNSIQNGAILLSGVGPNITNIQTIEQISNDAGTFFVQAATSANMALAGSATTLALDANYDHNDVTVTNLTNAMTVTYGGMGPDGVSTGSELGTLTLSHTLPVGLGQVLNFTMDSTAAVAPLELTVDSLVVASSAPALALVAVDSIGNAALNQITDINGVSANVTISGSTPINFGDSIANGYLLVGGTIDASADTGTVTTFLSATTGAGTGVAAQTFIAGTGTNNVTVANSGGDVIDFSHGGTDTVTFTATPAVGHICLPTPRSTTTMSLGLLPRTTLLILPPAPATFPLPTRTMVVFWFRQAMRRRLSYTQAPTPSSVLQAYTTTS